MLYYRPLWEEISKDEYNKLTKGLSDLELLFQSNFSKEPKFDLPTTGVGLMELTKMEIKEYRYYQRTGKMELVFYGSQKGCEAIEDAFSKIIK